MTYFAGRRDGLSTYRQECKMTVLRSQVWLLAVRRAVFSCPNLSLSGVYKKTPEGLWASRQATGWFEVSSGKETLRLVTDSTAKPNLVQKQVDMSALYRILKLAIVVTSNCQHFNKKIKKKKWTHVNETPLASTSTWLAVMGGGILWGLNSWFTGLSSEPCPGRGRESTEQEKWMTLVVEGTPYGRQRSEAFRPLPHTWDVPPRKSQKRKSRERERYSPPNIASHPRFKLTWAEETVRETFESLDGGWVFTLEQTAAVKRWRLGAVVSLLGLTDSTNLTLAARYSAQLLGNVSAKWVIQSVTGWSRQCAAVRGVLSCPLSATLPPLPVLAPQHSPRAPTDKPTRRVSIWRALLLVRDKVKSMQPGDDETATIVRTAPPRTCGNFPFFLRCHRSSSSSSSSLGIAGSPPWMEPSLIPPLLLRRVTWTRTRNHVFSTNTRTCRSYTLMTPENWCTTAARGTFQSVAGI